MLNGVIQIEFLATVAEIDDDVKRTCCLGLFAKMQDRLQHSAARFNHSQKGTAVQLESQENMSGEKEVKMEDQGKAKEKFENYMAEATARAKSMRNEAMEFMKYQAIVALLEEAGQLLKDLHKEVEGIKLEISALYEL